MTGCWDRIEINDVAIIIATAIDLEDDMYRVTVQLPLPWPIGDVNGGGGEPGAKKTITSTRRQGGRSWKRYKHYKRA